MSLASINIFFHNNTEGEFKKHDKNILPDSLCYANGYFKEWRNPSRFF